MDDFHGPYFDPSLFGPSGKLARLHKGGAVQPYVPPPAPIPKASDAAEGADQLVNDVRRLRGSQAQSFLAPTGAQSNLQTGRSFLG